MKKTICFEFTENDKVLLNTPLPDCPCDKCGVGIACCGCPKGRAYEEEIKPYRDAGIYEIAKNIRDMNKFNRQIQEKIKEYNEINKSLPDFVKKPTLKLLED